ncbi:MAG: VPDSG-CTERM sorting domain-containing protein [Verrucomicrobiales bacterium]
MPLGPGPNWSDVLTDVHLSLSTGHRSFGQTTAVREAEDLTLPEGQFFVSSFFDVFFDFSVTDVDPVRNFGGNAPDGQILSFTDIGPANMRNFYVATFNANAPNFGLIPPPEHAPYIGFFTVEIPLGADLNENGEADKIKFLLAAVTISDENRTFVTLPDGTVIENGDAIMDLSGAVVDESQDPPFSIRLTGPTTTISRLVPTVPDAGSTFLLQSAALGALACFNRRRGRKAR